MAENCFYEEGLHFECHQCSACCRYDAGHVFISDREVNAISDYLKMDRAFFIRQYCHRVFAHEKMRISLNEKKNHDCIFWDLELKGCAIYPVRPVQCSTFPFWPSIFTSKESWDRYEKECPGINKGKLHSKDSIESEIKRYEDELYRN